MLGAPGDAVAELRSLYRRARLSGPTWGEDTGRRRPSRVVGALVAELAREGDWLAFAKIVSAFRGVCGDAFASRVQSRALAIVRDSMPVRRAA